MSSAEKWAVGVVVYMPCHSDIEFVRSLVGTPDAVYVCDNSPADWDGAEHGLEELEGLVYWRSATNGGVATGANDICRRARSDGIAIIMFMDQDSRIERTGLLNVRGYVEDHSEADIFHVGYVDEEGNSSLMTGETGDTVGLCILSGLVVRVATFEALGQFDERFFMDAVDRDFCIRVALAGLSIRRVHGITLRHRIGSGHRNMLGLYEHDANRAFYMAYNRLLLYGKYSKRLGVWFSIRTLILAPTRQIASILLFETDKCQKLNAIWRAWEAWSSRSRMPGGTMDSEIVSMGD